MSWHERAACRGLDPDIFFPDPMDTAAVEEAKAICALCPVTLSCLTYSIATEQIIGVWGGQTELERFDCNDMPLLECDECGGDGIPVGNGMARCVECQHRWPIQQ